MSSLAGTATLSTFAGSPWARIGVGAAAFVVAGLTASSDEGTVLCPYRRCTGGYCPGCGLTRSTGQLLRGDVAGSWSQHPFLVLAVAQLAVIAGLWSLGRTSIRAWLSRYATQLVVANAALLGAIWIVRLATGAIPAPFS